MPAPPSRKVIRDKARGHDMDDRRQSAQAGIALGPRFDDETDHLHPQGRGDIDAQGRQEIGKGRRVKQLQDGTVHLIGPRKVLVCGRDDGAVGIFQPVQPLFQPLHRDSAQVDDIGAHGPVIGADQRLHHGQIVQQDLRLRQNPVARVGINHHLLLILLLVLRHYSGFFRSVPGKIRNWGKVSPPGNTRLRARLRGDRPRAGKGGRHWSSGSLKRGCGSAF